MQTKLQQRFERLLQQDDSGRPSRRLIEDAERLVRLIHDLARRVESSRPPDLSLMELAAYAIQLPLRQTDHLTVGKLGQINRRRLAEQAIEQLCRLMGSDLHKQVLEKLVQLLGDFHEKSPVTVEARLLSDVLNLEDFGLTGLLGFACRAGWHGQGITTVLEGARKREQYGYWEVRLREDFHFPVVRDLARQRHIELREWLQRSDWP